MNDFLGTPGLLCSGFRFPCCAELASRSHVRAFVFLAGVPKVVYSYGGPCCQYQWGSWSRCPYVVRLHG